MDDSFDVICIGAALIDIVANVERFPIDDDEVFVSYLQLLSGGAAANTAYICAKFGLRVAFIGKLGSNDEFGKKIITDFDKVSLDTSLIKYSKDYNTGLAYVALNKSGERRIFAYSGAANNLSSNDIIKEEIVKAKIIFLSSLMNLEPFEKASRIAKIYNIPVILNPGMLIIEQGFNNIKTLLENVDILILSKREFHFLLHLRDDKIIKPEFENKAKKIFKLGVKFVIITMGKDGALIINSKKSELIKAIEVLQVVDTTGAGDAFSAGFLYGFRHNISFKFEDIIKSVKIGNFIAGNCIQKLGAKNGIPDIDNSILESF